MKWNFEIEKSKNGIETLKLNGNYIYSKYNPLNDVTAFIKEEVSDDVEGYILFGLGLGYHWKSLVDMTDKPVFLVPVSIEDFEFFKKHSHKWENSDIEKIKLLELNNIDLKKYLNYKIIIPMSWLKAIDKDYYLFDYLESMKYKQLGLDVNFDLINSNIKQNLLLFDKGIREFKGLFNNKKAILVSAGPSLDHTVKFLKNLNEDIYILSVGAALNTLIKNSIIPHGVVTVDPLLENINQFKGINYNETLFYTATANHEVIKMYKGERRFIYHKENSDLEERAKSQGEDCLITGGTVATTAFSLLEYFGFGEIYLFGQDLGFNSAQTHSINSNSNKSHKNLKSLKKIVANDGSIIYTKPDLNFMRLWFENKMKTTKCKVYNTAPSGAKIKGIEFVKYDQFIQKINSD